MFEVDWKAKFKRIGYAYLAAAILISIYFLLPESLQTWINELFANKNLKSIQTIIDKGFIITLSFAIGLLVFAILIIPFEYLILSRAFNLNRYVRAGLFIVCVAMVCMVSYNVAASPQVQHYIQEFMTFFHSHG